MTHRVDHAGLVAGARRHALFVAALLLGVIVRAVVIVAYRPAMIFTDTVVYLRRAEDLRLSITRPSGYSYLLRLVGTDSLATVALLQHLLGLGLAVACYAFLLRRAVPRWAAVLATLPVLLDPLQLVLEHYVLSDVLFEALLVGACLMLLWRRRPGVLLVLVAGVLVAAAGLVRGAGGLLLPTFLVALLCLRPRWTAVLAFVVGGVVPVVAYASVFHQQHGDFALAQAGPRFLYARLAPVTPCNDVPLPNYERPLCPSEPVGRRPNSNVYMWGQHKATQWHLRVPEDLKRQGVKQVDLVRDFDKRIVRAQPRLYAKVILRDVLRGFAPDRTYSVPGYPAAYWLFADHYWSADTFPALRRKIADGLYGDIGYTAPAASAMAVYRQWVFTPGPVMALLLGLAVAAALGAGRARLSGDRTAAGLLSAACLVPLVTTAALSGFSWRYQLPQVALIPTAAALGITAMVAGRRPGAPESLPPVRPLDRGAAAVARLPMPRSWRRVLDSSVRRGWCQVVIGVLSAAAFGTAVALVAVASGWSTTPTAAAVGALTAAAALTALLTSAWRSVLDEARTERGAAGPTTATTSTRSRSAPT